MILAVVGVYGGLLCFPGFGFGLFMFGVWFYRFAGFLWFCVDFACGHVILRCLWPVNLVLLFAWLRAWAGLCFDCSVMVWVGDCFVECLDCVILRLIVLLCAVLFDVKCLVFVLT